MRSHGCDGRLAVDLTGTAFRRARCGTRTDVTTGDYFGSGIRLLYLSSDTENTHTLTQTHTHKWPLETEQREESGTLPCLCTRRNVSFGAIVGQ